MTTPATPRHDPVARTSARIALPRSPRRRLSAMAEQAVQRVSRLAGPVALVATCALLVWWAFG